jgi:hypothetical protein
MDTVKLDIQKLQLLNDRITQVLDALNQVRLSVHGLQSGLQHTPPMQGGPWQGQIQPWQPQPWPQTWQQTQPWQQTQWGMPGLQHTQWPTQPWTTPTTTGFQIPWGQQGLQHTTPWTQQPWTWGQQAWGQQVDPTWQIRTSQTFPFVQFPFPVG